MKRVIPVTKHLIRTALDTYVLPGTANGTEIIFIYARAWKTMISSSLRHVFHQDGSEEM